MTVTFIEHLFFTYLYWTENNYIFCKSYKISRLVAEKIMFLILHLISLVFRILSYFFVACILCLSCLIYIICVCLHIVVSNTYCVVFLSCVPNVASFSGLSILDCPFGLLWHLFQFKKYNYEYEGKQITSYLTGNEWNHGQREEKIEIRRRWCRWYRRITRSTEEIQKQEEILIICLWFHNCDIKILKLLHRFCFIWQIKLQLK